MKYLVGDVGGTNTRLSLADASGLRSETLMRARNEHHDSLTSVIGTYMEKHDCNALDGVCVAIAGPVQLGQGRLTNRDWDIQASEIAAKVGAPRCELINDLSALGNALPQLSLAQICGHQPDNTNGQALVVGMGTGFNVSLTKPGLDGRTVVFEAELGHAEVPASVMATLRGELGDKADRFETVESAFCGSGLERLYQAVAGRSLSGEDIMNAFEADTDPDATRTVHLFANGLGQLARTMICQYLPRDGLVFAGSASRGVLESAALPAFIDTFLAPGMDVVHPADIPVALITEDAAALHGCFHHLKASAPA
ncbi:ROK family protein [Shimia sp.]|uniref:glucokinase n=1 Tax=Shimia sp. TaxID=1954381 RepID=UPI003299001B